MRRDRNEKGDEVDELPDPPGIVATDDLACIIAIRMAYCSSVGECGFAASILTQTGFRDVAHCEELRPLLAHCRKRFRGSNLTRSIPIGDDVSSYELYL